MPSSSHAFSTHHPRPEERGVWSPDEHDRFLDAIKRFPNGPWKSIAAHVGTRSVRQVQTHAQKYREKVARRERGLQKHRRKVMRSEHRVDDATFAFVRRRKAEADDDRSSNSTSSSGRQRRRCRRRRPRATDEQSKKNYDDVNVATSSVSAALAFPSSPAEIAQFEAAARYAQRIPDLRLHDTVHERHWGGVWGVPGDGMPSINESLDFFLELLST
ncbi:hypothetical protein PINS_up015327 [Pythium insidiosum]|nr:hypothetical protein PINS_up015327 [Pythium insidiosum]